MEVLTSEEDALGGAPCSWEVGLGRVFAAVWRKDWPALKNNLQVREYSKRIDMSTHVIERLTALIADKQKEVLLEVT